MGIARSSYYYQPKRKSGDQDEYFRQRIESIHLDFPFYGYRRIQQCLLRQGLRVNHKKLRRIMGKYGLEPQVPRRFVATTQSDSRLKRYPNLLRGKETVDRLNQVWVADITYIRIHSGFIYLAVILDLCSRKVIGWALSKRIDKELPLAALRMAIEERRPTLGCIHHSDHGVQYASNDYIALLTEQRFCISMAERGNPYANAFAETFMKTLKYEEVYLSHYVSVEDVLTRVPAFIDEVYNTKRLHSSLGYLSPNEYEWMLGRQKSTDLN